MTDPLVISTHYWPDRQHDLRLIRSRVFIDEQGVSTHDEWDNEDATALHFLATQGDVAIGCARLLPEGRLTRMAVLADYRHVGVGRALLEAVLNTARLSGLTQVTLHAQLQAMAFYSKQGFTTRGDVFLEAGIPHREMFLNFDKS